MIIIDMQMYERIFFAKVNEQLLREHLSYGYQRKRKKNNMKL